ncbi:hypothetical protein D3C79_48970 [compost metagenome]
MFSGFPLECNSLGTEMAKAHLELFFERFLEYNLERYKDDPKFLALFTGLTFPDVAISQIIEIVDGTRRSSMVVSAKRRFKGLNQIWTPAPAATDLDLYTLQNDTPLASLEEAQEQTEVGLYSYIDGEEIKVVVVIAEATADADIATTVESVFRSAIQYEIVDVEVPAEGTTIVLNGDTYAGELQWVKGLAEILVIPDTDYGQLKGKAPDPLP